jgi:hypothetical protein
MLRSLLDEQQTLVRIEAYRALADNGDSAVIARRIVRPDQRLNFYLDIVPSKGPPIIYASRTGMPRIAIIGSKPEVILPALFTASDNRLMISSLQDRPLLSVYYRGPEVDKPVSVLSSPDVAELIGRLGGEGAPGEARLRFNYCDIVSLIQAMSDQRKLSASPFAGQQARQSVAFVLQEAPRIEQTIEEAPIIPDQAAQAPPVPTVPAEQNIGGAATASGRK